MTVVITRFPIQAKRLAGELLHEGYTVEVAGCIVETEAPGAAVIEAGYRSGVQAESMAGVSDPPCRSARRDWQHRWPHRDRSST